MFDGNTGILVASDRRIAPNWAGITPLFAALMSAALLGQVHRRVGKRQQRVDVQAEAFRVGQAQAGGAVHRQAVLAQHLHLGHRRAQALGKAQPTVAVGMDQQHHELFAAEARHQVALAQRAAHRLGHRGQCLVADGMSVRVVDLLEVVDVEQDRDHATAMPARLGQVAFGGGKEGAAVRQAGQEVGVGLVAQAGDQFVALQLQRLALARMALQRLHRADHRGHLVLGLRAGQGHLGLVARQGVERPRRHRQRLQDASFQLHVHRGQQRHQQQRGQGHRREHAAGLLAFGVGHAARLVQQHVAQPDDGVHRRHVLGREARRVQAVAAVGLAIGDHRGQQPARRVAVLLHHRAPGLQHRDRLARHLHPQLDQEAQFIDATPGAFDGRALAGRERLLPRHCRGEVRTQQAGVLAEFGRQPGPLHRIAQLRQRGLGPGGEHAHAGRQHRHHGHHRADVVAQHLRTARGLFQRGRVVHRRAGELQGLGRRRQLLAGLAVRRVGAVLGQKLGIGGEGRVAALPRLGQRLGALRPRRRGLAQHGIGGPALARHHLGGAQCHAQPVGGLQAGGRTVVEPPFGDADTQQQQGRGQGQHGGGQAKESAQGHG